MIWQIIILCIWYLTGADLKLLAQIPNNKEKIDNHKDRLEKSEVAMEVHKKRLDGQDQELKDHEDRLEELETPNRKCDYSNKLECLLNHSFCLCSIQNH